jgi:hypothetical protein
MQYIKEQLKCKEEKPVNFVFHGGSGSEKDKIEAALSYGVIKMNIDTDIRELSRTAPPPSLSLYHASSYRWRETFLTMCLSLSPISVLVRTLIILLVCPPEWAAWDGIRAFEAKNRDYLQVKRVQISLLFPASTLPLSVRLLLF